MRQISVQRGYDVEGYTLVCFGGAGGQHACRVAEALGVRRVMIHRLAGVPSAYGMGLADTRVMRKVTVEQRLDQDSAAPRAAIRTGGRRVRRARLRPCGARRRKVEILASAQVVKVEAGDVFIVETPGRGGHGPPSG